MQIVGLSLMNMLLLSGEACHHMYGTAVRQIYMFRHLKLIQLAMKALQQCRSSFCKHLGLTASAKPVNIPPMIFNLEDFCCQA